MPRPASGSGAPCADAISPVPHSPNLSVRDRREIRSRQECRSVGTSSHRSGRARQCIRCPPRVL